MAKDPLKDALDQKDADPEVVDPPEDDEEETDDLEDEDAYEAPSKEQWEKTQNDLRRARAQAKRLRESTTKPVDKEEAEDRTASTDARWQTRAMRSDAKAALLAEGADASLVDLALSRLKPGDIDYDEDDEPIGIDEWVEDMQDRYPRLFKEKVAEEKAPRRGTSLNQGAGAKAQRTPAKKSFGQMVMEAGAAQGGRRVRRG